MYKKTVLANGLKVVSHAMPARQSLALGIWIKAGGRYESEEHKGISHFLEHLLFKGTKHYSCRKLKESIEGLGGALNGFTSEELTCYLVKIPARYMELALSILSDMVLYPTLPGEEIEKEKTVILEEIKMYRDQPQSFVYELLDELLWPNQPLGQPIIGNEASVSSTTREDLISFKQRFYTPSNIVVSAAGCLEHDALRRAVEKIFSAQKNKDEIAFLKAQECQSKPQLKLLYKDTEQTHMTIGFHGLKRDHALRHALGVLHVLLGANMSSRLFNEVREKRGLAYEIGTVVKRFHDTGAFIVHAGVDNQKLIPALRLILKELAKVKERVVREDEFKRAKEFYMGQLMLALEDTLDHMLWIGESTAALDKIQSLENIMNEMKLVKKEDIRSVAKFILKEENLNVALIGPLKDQEKRIFKELVFS